MRLVRHALRYKPQGLISTEDDLYQEACVWILHFMWEWDEERGTSLSAYVVYNVGVRLRNQIEKELARKRVPLKPCIQIEQGSSFVDKEESLSGVIFEDDIKGEHPSPEELLINKRTLARFSKELPFLARELLYCLMLENGNFTRASREFRSRGRLRMTREMSDNALRLWLRRKYFDKLQTVLIDEEIIQSDARL